MLYVYVGATLVANRGCLRLNRSWRFSLLLAEITCALRLCASAVNQELRCRRAVISNELAAPAPVILMSNAG